MKDRITEKKNLQKEEVYSENIEKIRRKISLR
jgi:hypothetical protein